jgi:hypothetical protein
MPSSYVSGRVMSDQTEHSRAIIVGYVSSGHYFHGHYFQVQFLGWDRAGRATGAVTAEAIAANLAD